MRKSNKTLVLCMLALVLTLFPNNTSLSASFQEAEEPFVLEFLSRPRAETIAAMEFVGTEDSLPGALGVLTVSESTEEGTTNSILLIVNNQGQIVREFYHEGIRGYGDPQMFNETTLMLDGTPMGYLTFWNLETNTQYTIEAINGTRRGHHDKSYNPVTDTFVTLGSHEVVDAENESIIWDFDTIWEFNWNGDLLWEWNMGDWVSDWVPNFKDTQCMVSSHPRRGKLDYSHTNTIYWDPTTNIIYINPRNLDNVWAIEYPTGKVLWVAGRNGDFTMYDKHGNEKISLWWHSHSFYPVPGEPNKFILFDNDLHNGTAEPNIPTTGFEGGLLQTSNISRIVEVEIDPDTWTMRETWSWSAPPEYYSPVWGYARRLPNGNRIGCFGSRSFREGSPSYPFAEGGGSLIEVNEAGDIVWQVTFPSGWGIYRGRRFVPTLSLNSPTDLTCDQGVNDCPGIIWTSKSVFKDDYQITKDGELQIKDMWTTAKIGYELPSDLAIGTHEYTLTVVDLAGQSVSDTVKVTVEATVFEILPTVGVSVTLTIGLATVGVMILKRKKPWT